MQDFKQDKHAHIAIIDCILLNIHVTTVKPVYYRHLGTSKKCQGVLIFQVSLYNNVSFGIIARSVDYAGVHIFKCPD